MLGLWQGIKGVNEAPGNTVRRISESWKTATERMFEGIGGFWMH